MKLSTSKDANVNYLARIIKLEDSNFSPHPNADKLKLVHLHGNTISTGIDTTPGYYVYFPVECVIAPEFLKFHNLYRDATLNANSEEKGFFEESGRVKCIKLRGIASEGFIMPFKALKAEDLFDLDVHNHWNENFIDKLREKYLEKDSVLCKNKVPEEGIVLRREVTNIDVYKLKANRFLQKETQELDKGTIDIESTQE